MIGKLLCRIGLHKRPTLVQSLWGWLCKRRGCHTWVNK